MGKKEPVCKHFCSDWYQACAESFFEFDARSDQLHACTDESRAGVCARLREILPDGAALCRQSKLQVAAIEARDGGGDRDLARLCFDGRVPPLLETCKRVPSGKRKHHKTQEPSELVDARALWGLLAAGGVVALFTCRRQLLLYLQRLFVSRAQPKFRGKPKFAR